MQFNLTNDDLAEAGELVFIYLTLSPQSCEARRGAEGGKAFSPLTWQAYLGRPTVSGDLEIVGEEFHQLR